MKSHRTGECTPHAGRRDVRVRRCRSFGVAGAVVLVVAGVAGCSSSKPTSSSTTSVASSGQSATSAPLAGGVAYLQAYQALNDTRLPLLSTVDNSSSKLTDLLAATRELRTAETTFDTSVRKITFPVSVRLDVNSMLTAHNALVAALDTSSQATSVAAFGKANTLLSSTGQAADTAEIKVGSDVDAFTDKPTKHLAATRLSVVIPGLAGQPLSTEITPGGGASYIPSGYQQVVPSGQLGERSTKDFHLTDTTVSTKVTLSGKSDPKGNAAAFIICRSSASGTTSGTEYLVGYDVTGTLYITSVDPAGFHVLLSGSSDAAKSDTEVGLRADCVDSYLTLYMNGTPAIQVYDDQYKSGNVGLSTGGPGAAVYRTFTASGVSK